MLKKTKSLIINNYKLLAYTFWNYIDKLIAFALPLSVLYILKDHKAYNDIEYIFSIANIAIILMEFGLKTFFFYGYRISKQREEYIINVKKYFDTLLIIYATLGIILIPLIFISTSNIYIFLIFILIRSLFLLLVSFNNYFYRLIDCPSRIFLYTIPVNILSLIAIYIISITQIESSLLAFFLPESILILLIVVESKKISFNEIPQMINYLKTALNYSWPIILNLLISTFVNNYGKLYAYNFLSTNDMSQISYYTRISMIIFLSHSSIIAYYSKSIYTHTESLFNWKVYKIYNLFLGLSILAVIFIIEGINLLSLNNISFNNIALILIVYIVFWCQLSYFEMYINILNSNRLILISTFISASIFMILVYSTQEITLIKIVLYMLLYSFLNFIIIISYLIKKGIFKK